jgi:redox-sensitive bicupin YhaK (pirin superfamily)
MRGEAEDDAPLMSKYNGGEDYEMHEGDFEFAVSGSGLETELIAEPSWAGTLHFLMIWIKLPEAMQGIAPVIQNATQDILPIVQVSEGVNARVMLGSFAGRVSPVESPVPALFLDVDCGPFAQSAIQTDESMTTRILFCSSGQLEVNGTLLFSGDVLLFSRDDKHVGKRNGEEGKRGEEMTKEEGDEKGEEKNIGGGGKWIDFRADAAGCQFFFLAGQPINEPTVQYGPFVMNSEADIRAAFVDEHQGSLVRWDQPLKRYRLDKAFS